MIAVPFKPEHLAALRVQAAQAIEWASVTPELAVKIAHTNAWTIVDGETVVFCGGLVATEDKGLLWALLSPQARMLTVSRMVGRFLSLCSGPVETWVKPDFGPACRWAEMFGLTRRELAPYGVDGSHYYRYVGDL